MRRAGVQRAEIKSDIEIFDSAKIKMKECASLALNLKLVDVYVHLGVKASLL